MHYSALSALIERCAPLCVLQVDDTLVARGVSEADLDWVRNHAPLYTIQSWFEAVQPAGADGGVGLRRGTHVVRVSPQGETHAAVQAFNLSTRFYGEHAVHIRAAIVTYAPLPHVPMWDTPYIEAHRSKWAKGWSR